MAKNASTAGAKLSTHGILSIFHHISVIQSRRGPGGGAGGAGGPFEGDEGPLGPPSPDGRPTEGKKNKDPKKKPLYIRKEFPETWLWTEQMVK